jgi:hypothetical protein
VPLPSGYPVAVAADIFLPATIAFAGNGLRHHVVEEGAVVADQEHRAVVVLQQGFEQLQGFDVEVVGRLVEHQHVGRPREQARQQQAVALAAGERLDRRTRALRAKRKSSR